MVIATFFYIWGEEGLIIVVRHFAGVEWGLGFGVMTGLLGFRFLGVFLSAHEKTSLPTDGASCKVNKS